MTSIVIPAHNEERVIGRLLDALVTGEFDDSGGPRPAAGRPDAPETPDTPDVLGPPDIPNTPDIVVVCNGCTDDTAKVAGARPGVRVVEIPVPSKHEALRTGDEHARGFPRLYVDADVVLGAADVRALTAALADAPELLATAPARDLPLAGCAWRVRAYYRVWTRLPAVREGLFGRGVIAVTEEGHHRLAALPPLMADDLAASMAFGPGERRVVDGARVVVHPPRTWADLIRRRIRAAVSTAQLESRQAQEAQEAQEAQKVQAAREAREEAVREGSVRAPANGALPEEVPEGARGLPEQTASPSARTSTADLRTLLRGEPKLLPSIVVFLAAAVTARRKAAQAIRDQDFGTWLRDESSREG